MLSGTVLLIPTLLSQIPVPLNSHGLCFQSLRSIHSACLPLAIASFVLLLALSLCFRRPPPNPASPAHPLKALLFVITPTCSLWPQNYVTLTKARQSKIIRIPLKILIEDVIAGKIEFRSPEDDLKRLLHGNGRLPVEGWALVLSLGSLWLSGLWWWMKSGLYAGSYKPLLLVIPEFRPAEKISKSINSFTRSESKSNVAVDYMRFTSSRLGAHTPGSGKHRSSSSTPLPPNHQKYLERADSVSKAVSVLPALLPTLPSQTLRKIAIATTLDSTPHPHLETALLLFQTCIPSGELGLLEFTSCEQSLSVWCKAWILSAIPFFYSSRLVLLASKSQRPRTVSPFTNTLPCIITLLESGTTRSIILSIQNVSAQYAQLLNVYAQKLEERAGRARFLASFDDKDLACCAWRAEVLWARWEAACYTSGLLTRWVICAKRPS